MRGGCIVGLLAVAIAALTCTGKPGSFVDPSPHRVQYVTVDSGVKLEVLDWGGAGRPIVLLAGLGNTGHIYDEFAPLLVSSYHVFAITRRGCGASTHPASRYSADRLADDVLAVLDRLGLPRPILVGHSLAGEELSSIGVRYPDRIAGLVYLDAAYKQAYDPTGLAGQPGGPSPGSNRPPQPPGLQAGDRSSFRALRAWCIHFEGFAPPEAELRQEFESTPDGGVGPSRTPPAIESAILSGTQRFTEISAPTLAIYAVPHSLGPWVLESPELRAAADEAAKRDVLSTGAQADAFERGVKGVRVVRLPYANHYIFMSNAADVVREINAFASNLR